jgi:hypothetical protein
MVVKGGQGSDRAGICDADVLFEALVCDGVSAREERECFLSGHIHAFAYFGGVPSRISYDNVATAVSVRIRARRRETGAQERREPDICVVSQLLSL